MATQKADAPKRKLTLPLEFFVQKESAGGILLIAVALVAFVWANSPWNGAYESMKAAQTGIQLGAFALEKPLVLWVNDLLMAIFFFLVGLEIKRELLVGELNSVSKASLPLAGALGGMVVPALIYWLLTAGTPFVSGWGVPMATDIAFALGVLALLGPAVPSTLKVFLLALAIVDDLGAVTVIAVFYTSSVDLTALGLSLAVWLVAVVYGLTGGWRPLLYVVIGAVTWYFMLKSGVHATIAGVLMALAVPLRHSLKPEELERELQFQTGGTFEEYEVRIERLESIVHEAHSPLHNFEHSLVPWVAFFIMPVFALFNAGVNLGGGGTGDAASDAALVSAATWGAFLGLLLGKPLGISAFVWIGVRLGLVRLPAGIGWAGVVGVGLLAGIGFTMALFIANLAFETQAALDQAKLGVLAASIVAGITGFILLKRSLSALPAGETARVKSSASG